MRCYLLTLAAAIALAAPAHAEEFVVQGIGTSLCSKITQLYHNFPDAASVRDTDLMIASWASGYMSATNMARTANGVDTQNLASLPWQQQVIAIRRYCKHNPTKTMMAAVMTLFAGFTSNVDADNARVDFK